VDSSAFGPRTIEGRTLPLMKISDNVRENEDEPNVIMVSMHHAREIITPVILMDFIEDILTSDDAGMQALLNNNQIYVMPIANPDGSSNSCLLPTRVSRLLLVIKVVRFCIFMLRIGSSPLA
jgi:murein tripeptide amidase MpaA